MTRALIIAASKIIDQVGSHQPCQQLEARISRLGIPLRELVIEPLSVDWHSPEREDHFRSGCAPIEALARAKQLIEAGEQAVLIRGEDYLKSGYDRDERRRLMAIYGEDYPLTGAYTELARYFLEHHRGDEAQFRHLAHCLFENYKLSYRYVLADDFTPQRLPGEQWYRPITPLFRGVDCANPLVDFSGRLLIASDALAARLELPASATIELKGIGLGRLPGDGPAYLEQIARYEHLRHAYEQCCAQANVDFADQFRAGEALLEAYTCYPVVPLAFLLVSGLVELLEEIPAFLARHRITVTGGMNLARGPWNNPALNALISMYQHLRDGEHTLGAVHGNGGLGYRQGVALLGKCA